MGLTHNIIHQVTSRRYHIHHTCKHQEHQTLNTSPHTIKTHQQQVSQRLNMTKPLTEEKDTKENHQTNHNLNLYSQLCPLRPDNFSLIPSRGGRQDATGRSQTTEQIHPRKKSKIVNSTMVTVPIMEIYLKLWQRFTFCGAFVPHYCVSLCCLPTVLPCGSKSSTSSCMLYTTTSLHVCCCDHAVCYYESSYMLL